METIAVYWEETIRTYGFTLFEGQTCCRMHLTNHEAAQWEQALQTMEEGQALFRLVWAQAESPSHIKFFLLCDDNHWQNVRSCLTSQKECRCILDKQEISQVDMVYFQGPHFGDRYGILDFTYKALDRGQIPILGVVCSVASVYLIAPLGRGAEIQKCLSQAFEIPKEKRSLNKDGVRR